MIPEKAKSEIKRKKAAGQSWSGIVKWLETEYGIDIHRTTVQRWHDKEVYSDELEVEDTETVEAVEFLNDRIKLDKKIATYKAEANYFKKLYETSIKNDAKKEIIIEAIKNFCLFFLNFSEIFVKNRAA